MTVDTYSQRREELLKAVKMVSTMSTSDIAGVVQDLIRENQELQHQLNRLKEDKEENEAAYERVIHNLQEEIKNTNKGLRRKSGGKE